MAKLRRKATTTTAITRYVPQIVRTPAPVIRIAAPRAAVVKHKGHRRHHRGGSTALSGKLMLGAGLGGAILGFVETKFPTLPTVPLLGRSGTVALAAYLLNKQGMGGGGGIMRDVALAGAVVAGYELGKEGKIAGEDDAAPANHEASGQILTALHDIKADLHSIAGRCAGLEGEMKKVKGDVGDVQRTVGEVVPQVHGLEEKLGEVVPQVAGQRFPLPPRARRERRAFAPIPEEMALEEQVRLYRDRNAQLERELEQAEMAEEIGPQLHGIASQV